MDSADRKLKIVSGRHTPLSPHFHTIKQWFQVGFFVAITDARATLNKLKGEVDLVPVHNTITGICTSESFLDYPPTGNKINFDTVDLYRLRDGKLGEYRDVADTRALFSQVGATKD